MAIEPRRQRQLRGTPAEWTANAAFVPAPGEICVELNGANTKIKVGDGTTNYGALPYLQSVDATARADIATLNGTVTSLSAQVTALAPLAARVAALESAVAALQGVQTAAALDTLRFDFGTAVLTANAERAIVLATNVDFGTDFPDAVGAVKTNPTAAVTFELRRGATKIADVGITTAGVITTTSATPGADVLGTAGDLITLILTSAPDTTFAGFRYSVPATITI